MTGSKIAVEIKKVRDPQGDELLIATVPIRTIFEKNFDGKWLNDELKKFEADYFRLVNHLSGIVKAIRSKEQRNRVLLYWEFGNELHKYTEDKKSEVLFLNNMIKHLSRDLGVSEKFISRCKKFRVLYPDVSRICLDRSFNSYVVAFEGGYISTKRRMQRGLKSQEAEVKDA